MELEFSILTHQEVLAANDASELFKSLSDGKYADVLTSAYGKVVIDVIVNLSGGGEETSSEELFATTDSSLKTLALAIAALQLFVQNNWVGPTSQISLENVGDEEKLLESLRTDGENVYELCSNPILLWISRKILIDWRQKLSASHTTNIWALRCVQIQQALLNERSPSLKAIALGLIREIAVQEKNWTFNGHREVSMLFHVQAGNLCHYYYEPSQAKEHFTTAQDLSGLEIGLTGALGKRTFYQQKEISQLVVIVNRINSEGISDGIRKEAIDLQLLPKMLSLDDDTVMEQIKFVESENKFSVEMTSAEQVLLLALLNQHRKFHEGLGSIILEESSAYINCVLQQPRDWCVISKALFMRSTLENDSSRRIERCMRQLEELVNQCDRPEPTASHRMRHVYDTMVHPKWKIECELAELFTKVGAINAALEIYLRLEKWEEVIKCYIASGRSEKAETTIKEQLAIKETPEMLCYLGDVTHDEEHYLKSWEVSNNQYHRAQRNLAYLYLNKGEFEKSLPCFEKSLSVNPLQVGVWFSYGCAAIGCVNFEVAATAFRRCVTLDANNHEAWNNLSTAYIRSNQKPRAFLTLQEALKCDFENWRIWENYLLVGVDIGEFDEVIRAYHRLLEMRGKHEDSKVLSILGRAINTDLPDADGKPSGRLREKGLKLLGHVTAKVTNNGDIWKTYGELLMSSDNISQIDRERALQYFQKCHRCNTQLMNWEKDVEKCKSIAAQSSELADVYLKCNEFIDDNGQATRLLSSARLMLKGVVSKIKQRHTDPVSKELFIDLKDSTDALENALDKIVKCIDGRKAASS